MARQPPYDLAASIKHLHEKRSYEGRTAGAGGRGASAAAPGPAGYPFASIGDRFVARHAGSPQTNRAETRSLRFTTACASRSPGSKDCCATIAGAGISGIGIAHYLRTLCPQRSFDIVEARGDIGGTVRRLLSRILESLK